MPLSKKCLWYITLVYDVIFGISGFIFLCVNSLILYKILRFKTLININILAPIITHIVAGFLYILLSWCGWRVVFKLHGLHLKLYSILLAILVILQFSCIVWTVYIQNAVLKHEITESVEKEFSLLLEANEHATTLWDKIQSQLSCCGIGGPTDYRKSKAVPWSCCKRAINELSGDCPNVHQHGCLLNVYDETHRCLTYSLLSCFGMAIVQVCGVVSYLSLAKAIRRSSNTSASVNDPNLSSTQTEENRLSLLNTSPRKF